MAAEIDRQLGRNILATVLKQPKNCELFEKYIYEHVEEENADQYNWYIYQTAGLILKNPTTLKQTAKDVKEGKLGWKSTTYEQIASKIDEFDQYLVHPFDVVAGVTVCPKCHSNRTWNVQKQTRSSDEPMTTFSRCVECGNEWSYSG